MATEVARLTAYLDADTKRFDAQMRSSEGKLKKTSKVAGMAGAALAGVFILGARMAIKSATAQQEALNKATVTFETSAATITEWSKTTAKAMGISRTAALQAAGGFGALFQKAGQTVQESAKMSQAFVKTAADLGSFHDVDPTEVLEALRSGLAGETEPLRRFNIFMNEATVKAFAYKEGIAKTGVELTENQKILARQAFILENVGKAQDDFAETSESAANQARIQKAVTEDLSASLGTALLPAWQKIQEILISLATWLQEHETLAKALGLAVAALAVALLAAAAAGMLLNLALIANPIGLLIVGVVALIAVMIALVVKFDFVRRHWWILLLAFGLLPGIIALIIKHFGTLKARAMPVIDGIKVAFGRMKTAAVAVKDFIVGTLWPKIRPILDNIRQRVNTVKDAFQSIIDKVQTLIGWIGTLIGKINSIPSPRDVGGGILDAVLPGRASGGPVQRGRSYIVGERGPELFRPNMGGRIIPNVPAMSRRGGGGTTVNIYVPSSAMIVDAGKLVRYIDDARRTYGRRGG